MSWGSGRAGNWGSGKCGCKFQTCGGEKTPTEVALTPSIDEAARVQKASSDANHCHTTNSGSNGKGG